MILALHKKNPLEKQTPSLVTGTAGFIGFHLANKLLELGHKVHGFDSMNSYYDVKLKKARYNILKKNKNFSFTKSKLQNTKSLKESESSKNRR